MKRIFIVAIITFILFCKPSHLTEREFTEKFVDVLSKSHPDIKYTINGDLSITAKIKEGTHYHYLDNAYKEYKMDPESLDKIVQAYALSSSELYNDSEEMTDNNIIPVIKPVDYLDEIKKLGSDLKVEEGIDTVYESYNDSLIVMYVENKETSFNYFSQKKLDKLGIPRKKLREIAVRNLKSILKNIEIQRWDNGIIEIIAGGIFETSLVLLPKIWIKNEFHLRGDIVIAIPSRGILLLAGSHDGNAITTLKSIALKSYAEESYSISPYLFKWNGSNFEKWK